jgi:hypothetical protein
MMVCFGREIQSITKIKKINNNLGSEQYLLYTFLIALILKGTISKI